jgi:hypothetical protein
MGAPLFHLMAGQGRQVTREARQQQASFDQLVFTGLATRAPAIRHRIPKDLHLQL